MQRLLEHTDPEHSDYLLLRRAERQIHELALQISSVEKEATEQVFIYSEQIDRYIEQIDR